MSTTEFGRGSDGAGLGQTHTRHAFIFNGTGKEYFGIWIVNILLSIVTLGIYSAWAKVRTKRYFNGNLELNGHRFDYHANPIAILKGRIIVVIVLVVISLLNQLHPLLGIAVFVFYAIALPWVIVRGLRFNANMTSYRNVRFHFEGTKWDAFKAYIVWPFLASISSGGLIPYASRANVRFLGNGHSFGTAKFSADPPLKPYYRALGLAVLLLIVPLAVLAIAVMGMISGVSFDFAPALFPSILVILAYLGLGISFFVYAALARNIGFNNLLLKQGHGFNSTVTVKSYIWIVVTNALLTIVTLGIYIPWARVRMANYLADNTAMLAAGDLDGFASGQTDNSGVASGEFLDIEGLDFGL